MRQKNFIDILQQKREVDFFSVLRVTRATFNKVLHLVAEGCVSSPSGRNIPLGPVNALYVTLRYSGHQVTYIQIFELFGFSLSTIHECVQKVTRRFIRWPQREKVIKAEKDFHQIAGMCNVMETIGGCHVAYKGP